MKKRVLAHTKMGTAHLIRRLDTPMNLKIRCVALFAVAAFLLGACLVRAAQLTGRDLKVEGRISSLEESVRGIKEDMSELKFWHIIETLGISGMVGEAAIRVIKRR
jgi:hypothetical protein